MTFFMDGLWSLCWRGTLLSIVVALGILLVPRRALAIRSALLRVALWGLVALPLTLLFPHLPVAVLPGKLEATPPEPTSSAPTRQDIAATDTRTAVTLEPNSLPANVAVLTRPTSTVSTTPSTGVIDDTTTLDPQSDLQSVDAQTHSSSAPEVALLPNATPRSTSTTTTPTNDIRLLVIPMIYGIGLIVLLARLVMGIRQVHRLHRESVVNSSPIWTEALEEYCRVLYITRPVELRVSAQIHTPLTYGWRRPTLVIPAALVSTADTLHRRAVLLHELTHVQRGDFATQIAMHLAQAIHWYQPLVWILGRALRASQEDLCDAECSAEFGGVNYSDMLVQIAQSLRAAPSLTLTLAMARTSRLAKRLTRIHAYSNNAMLRMPRLATGLLLIFALPLALGLFMVEPVRAQRPVSTEGDPAPAKADEPEAGTRDVDTADGSETPPKPVVDAAKLRPDVALPRVVFQLAESENRSPMTGVKVQIRRLIRDVRPNRYSETVWEGTSDNEGIVAISVPELNADLKEVNVEVQVPDRVVELWIMDVQRTNEKKSLETLEAWPAQQIASRVFDTAGRPAGHVEVGVLADTGAKNRELWGSGFFCDADGQFKIQVPKNTTFGIIITSELGAPYRAVFPAGTQQIRDIHLMQGSVVSGQLIDRNGKPIPNCEIVMRADDSQAVNVEYTVQRHGWGALFVELFCTTDKQGSFKFTPMSGPAYVHLVGDAQERLVPVSLNLPTRGETWLPLVLPPTGTVSGTVRWPDGRPAAKVGLSLFIPQRDRRRAFGMGAVKTDAQGHYEFSVPFPVDEIAVNGGLLQEPNDQYWDAHPIVDGVPQSWDTTISLTRYVGQALTLDWVMVSRVNGAFSPTAAPETDATWQALADLEMSLEHDRAMGSETQQPTMDRCLKFEEKHRGTRRAIGALYFIMRAAATEALSVPRIARERAIQVIANHYIKHPDVDLVIDEFDAGCRALFGEPVLQRIAEESPFDYVRATALYQLARHKLLLSSLKATGAFEREESEKADAILIAMQESQETADWLTEQFNRHRQMRKALANLDGESLRQSGLDLLERVTTRYSGVNAPRRRFRRASGEDDPTSGHPELKLVDDNEPVTWRIRTIAERAQIQFFQKTRLQVGMKAPDMEGLDLRMQPIRLSQFRGKVVLLTMTLTNSETELHAECAKIIKTINDDRFACVSVIPGSGSGGVSVLSIVEDEKVTWPIIRDSTEDDVGHLWCQRTFPSMYVIDPDGVIQNVEQGRYEIEGLLGKVQNQMKKLPKPQ